MCKEKIDTVPLNFARFRYEIHLNLPPHISGRLTEYMAIFHCNIAMCTVKLRGFFSFTLEIHRVKGTNFYFMEKYIFTIHFMHRKVMKEQKKVIP